LPVPARSVSGAGGKAECLEIKVTGAREIEKILKELGPTAANRIARSALNRSATPIVRRAKELVPVATGELKRATTRRQRRGSDKQEILIGKPPPRSRSVRWCASSTAPLAPLPCLSAMAYRRCEDCLDEESCAIRRVFALTHQVTATVLDRTTLADALKGRPLAAAGGRLASSRVLHPA
jgi:hypothetical protein